MVAPGGQACALAGVDEPAEAMKRHRPLTPVIVPWRSPGPTGGHSSYGAVARRRHRAWIYCKHCVPPWSIDAIDFNDMPWRRYLNYPSEARFRCPACRNLMSMLVMDYDMPGTGGDKPEY